MKGMTKSQMRTVVREWVQAAQELCGRDKSLVKRLLPRFTPWADAIELRSGGNVVIARGRDICLEGVGLTCRYEFRRGEIVEMRRAEDDFWLPIVIRHCTATVGGFKIGARFLFD